jgi:hypothetical protein
MYPNEKPEVKDRCNICSNEWNLDILDNGICPLCKKHGWRKYPPTIEEVSGGQSWWWRKCSYYSKLLIEYVTVNNDKTHINYSDNSWLGISEMDIWCPIVSPIPKIM